MPFLDGAHHLSSNYNKQQNKTCSLPWNSWMKRKTKEHSGAFIILTIDMSDHRLHQHAIQISSHRHLWYSSRHYSFVVPQVCHATATHTHVHTHVHTQLPYIRLLLKWLLMFEFGFEICWYRRYSMWGWDHFKHKTAFPEQNTEKPFPAGIHVCVFLINIHTAWDQLISSDHFFNGGVIPVFS